jgi:hypothetical protein
LLWAVVEGRVHTERIPYFSDDDEHSLGAFAAATDMNQLASNYVIAVEYRVSDSFPKGEFYELLLSANATGASDQTHEPVRKR